MGDAHRLSRTVVPPEGLGQRALDRIAAAEQEMNHRARRTDGPDGVTFETPALAISAVRDLESDSSMGRRSARFGTC